MNTAHSPMGLEEIISRAKEVGLPEPHEDAITHCALCGRPLWWRDSWSPGDDAICAECDTGVTGRAHPPSVDPRTSPPPEDVYPELTRPAPQLYIVNEFDRPFEYHLAEKVDGKFYYVHPNFRDDEHFHGMQSDNATPLEDFAVTTVLRNGVIHGSHDDLKASKAAYADGRLRRWQGSRTFSFHYRKPSP